MNSRQSGKPLHPNLHRYNRNYPFIHSDVCGPMSVPSYLGAWYYVSFIDEITGWITLLQIRSNSKVLQKLKQYQFWLDRLLDCSIKRLHTHNGSEFIALSKYQKQHGIKLLMSPPYSTNQNFIAERLNQIIMESARSMLDHYGLPRKFWAEAVSYAVRIQNSIAS